MKMTIPKCIFLAAAASIARADIAVMHEKGPKAGSLLSIPGISESSPKDLKVAMRQADVRIRLKPAGDGNLAADVVATFELEDLASSSAGKRTFLVAFPVTGLRSQVLAVTKFKVLVDGKAPAVVLRHAIAIGYHRYDLEDTPVSGLLDASFSPDKEPSQTGVFLADESGYPDAYAWTQTSQPGTKTAVIVTYTATLKPQEIKYSKSYQPNDDDREVIPFDDIEVPKWDAQYFFFDYVLLSGATWEGTIGREEIEITSDPALKLEPSMINYTLRSPVGRKQGNQKPAEHSSNAIVAFLVISAVRYQEQYVRANK